LALVACGWHQDQHSLVLVSQIISQLVVHDLIDVQMAQMTPAPKKINQVSMHSVKISHTSDKLNLTSDSYAALRSILEMKRHRQSRRAVGP
jgi:hypothetical protein